MGLESKGTVTVVGVGPGDPEYLSRKAERAIGQAEVVFGGARVLDGFSAPGQEKFVVEEDWNGLIANLNEKRFRRKTAVLVSGDPGLFSLLALLRRHFQAEELDVIPGISAPQMLFARISEPWQEVEVLSLHGRTYEDVGDSFKKGGRFCLLTDKRYPPSRVAQLLTDQGFKGRAVVGHRLSYPDERIEELDLEELAEAKDLDGMSVVYLDLTPEH